MSKPSSPLNPSVRTFVLLLLLGLVLVLASGVSVAHARKVRVTKLQTPVESATKELVPPPPYPVIASDFSGWGVKVGIVDVGFNHGENSPHAKALSGVIKGHTQLFETQSRDHGSIVARIVAGKQIGDGYGQGTVQNSHLYVAMYSPHRRVAVYDEFSRSGVNIVNHSWAWEPPVVDRLNRMYTSHDHRSITATLGDKLHLFRQAVDDAGQLLIWSAGNEKQAHVSWPARLPVVAPALEKGWLAVTSIHPDGKLKLPANACGVAANWCLSSIEGNAGGQSGTSFATPVVTGVAAQVSEAFPWMDNHALRQTLLSTADSLGSPAIYGWGRVNADRAVRGPALFDSRLTFGQDFEAEFDRHRSEFFNDIGGDRGLIKSGTGALVLWGKNTYTGTTKVNGGTLELYGRVAGDVVVRPRSALHSNGGTIAGNLDNTGTVSMLGKGLHVQGNYTASNAKGELVAPLGVALTVDGTAHLSGTAWEFMQGGIGYVIKESGVLVQAAEIVGEFDWTAVSLLYTVDVDYFPTKVVLELGAVEIGGVASYYDLHTAWQAAALAVDTAFAAIDNGLLGQPVTVSDEFFAQAGEFQQIASVPELATALESLTGEVYASSQALSFQHTQMLNRALSHRVNALSQASQTEGLWFNMLGAEGKLRQRGYTGVDTRLFGAQLGVDHRVCNDLIVGAAFSWSESKAAFKGLGGHSSSQSLGLSLYGRYGASAGNYLSGRIGHDWITTDVSRDIVISASEHIDSVRHDGMTSTYLELGHVFQSGQTTYTPYLGAEYNYFRRGAFQETGSAFALRAASASYQQGAVSVGMRYQWQPIAWAGGDMTLSVTGVYRYGNPTSLDFTAAFIGAPHAAFELRGIGLSRQSGWLGVGVVTQLPSRTMSWFINVDIQLEEHGLTNNSVLVGLRYEFV